MSLGTVCGPQFDIPGISGYLAVYPQTWHYTHQLWEYWKPSVQPVKGIEGGVTVSYIIVRELQWNLSKADTIASLCVYCEEVSVLWSQVWLFVLRTQGYIVFQSSVWLVGKANETQFLRLTTLKMSAELLVHSQYRF